MAEQVTTEGALERGRYALYSTPDGGFAVARAVDLCPTCLGCRCGEPAPALEAPGWLVKMAQSQGGVMAKARALLGAARNGQEEPPSG